MACLKEACLSVNWDSFYKDISEFISDEDFPGFICMKSTSHIDLFRPLLAIRALSIVEPPAPACKAVDDSFNSASFSPVSVP